MIDERRRRGSRADRRRTAGDQSRGAERRREVVPAVRISWTNQPDGIVVTLTNLLVVSNCFPVRDRLVTYCEKFTAQRIMVDLSGVPYADTAGLGMLVEMRTRFRREGKELIVRNPTPRVSEIIEILQMERGLFS